MLSSKLMASALTIAFSTIGGLVLSEGLKERRDTLRELIVALSELKNYISGARMPLPEIYVKLSGKTSVGKMFDKMSRENTSDTYKLWEKHLSALKLKKEDIVPLKDLAKTLGYGNVTHQKTCIDICVTGLEKHLREAETSYEKEGKLYRKLGIYAGILLVIIKVG